MPFLVAGLSAALLATAAQAKGPSASHARMVAELAAVARETPPGFPFVGDIEHLRGVFAGLAADASPQEQWTVRSVLALAELKLGNFDRAIQLYGEADEIVETLPAQLREDFRPLSAFFLGVAHLRDGEVANCVKRHNGDACILPILAAARHVDPAGSRAAMRYFVEVLDSPGNARLKLAARWLLNLAAMTLGEYPQDVPEPHALAPEVFGRRDFEFPRFRNVAPSLQLDVVDQAGGAVVDDFDGDGLLDVLVSTWDTAGPLHLFKNRGGLGFEERSEAAGLTGLIGGLNMIHADYDNDGDVDVLVLRGAWLGLEGRHPNSLLRNDGAGNFEDVTFAVGLGEVHYPTQTAAWADYDGDGDLDLYIGNEAPEGAPFPSQLFRNDGAKGFVDVAEEAGVANLRWSKGVSFGDYDADGDPDLYVSNFLAANRLYRNRGDGSFEDVAAKLGVEGPRSSFTAWFWDFDNDGVLDLMVNSYQVPIGSSPPDVWYLAASRLGLEHPAELPSLYRGDGSGGFADVGRSVGLDVVTLPMGANFGDLDGDGFLDFYLGTGYPAFEGLIPNVMYRNDRGKRFDEVTWPGGFGHLQKGHGVAFADIDNDGDQDVFEQIGGFFPGDAFANALFENPGFGAHWVTLKLVGVAANRSAIGAHVRLDVSGEGRPRSIHRWVGSGASFGSSPLRLEVGLGASREVERLVVEWPGSGRVQSFEKLEADRFYEITEGEPKPKLLQPPTFELTAESR